MPNVQARIRKSGQAGNWSYSYAVRQYNENGQIVETRRQVDRREYAVSLCLSLLWEIGYLIAVLNLDQESLYLKMK